MSQLPNALRAALAPFAPPQSEVQFTEEELQAADLANHRHKAERAYAAQERNALRLQMADQTGAFE